MASSWHPIFTRISGGKPGRVSIRSKTKIKVIRPCRQLENFGLYYIGGRGGGGGLAYIGDNNINLQELSTCGSINCRLMIELPGGKKRDAVGVRMPNFR